jgi:hypothetical protein
MSVATIGTASSLGSIALFDHLPTTSSILLETATRKAIRAQDMHEHYEKRAGFVGREAVAYS